jgi:hypothetical protein
MIHQDLAHRVRRERLKVRPVIPRRPTLPAGELDESLMDQRRGLERVILALLVQVGRRESTQRAVHLLGVLHADLPISGV